MSQFWVLLVPISRDLFPLCLVSLVSIYVLSLPFSVLVHTICFPVFLFTATVGFCFWFPCSTVSFVWKLNPFYLEPPASRLCILGLSPTHVPDTGHVRIYIKLLYCVPCCCKVFLLPQCRTASRQIESQRDGRETAESCCHLDAVAAPVWESLWMLLWT